MTYYKKGSWNAICLGCNEKKSSESFYIHSNGKPRKKCKQCHLKISAQWTSRNKIQRTLSAKSRLQNPEKKEKALEATRRWRIKNKAYDAHRSMMYRQRKTNQMPLWCDINKIKEIYLHCPAGHHVDHIVPLKGKFVSGLHVPWNLQYLPAKENLQKRNLYVG